MFLDLDEVLETEIVINFQGKKLKLKPMTLRDVATLQQRNAEMLAFQMKGSAAEQYFKVLSPVIENLTIQDVDIMTGAQIRKLYSAVLQAIAGKLPEGATETDPAVEEKKKMNIS